ncbi:TenA family protein [Brevibacterium sp. ZH18]|uniref:TenA family protein n=1 Tax=Brevibacterium sp. ZH18 TaxID=2927784 RepID=UPI001F60B4DB|nr:TenA family protein [Brevibacterium sp. ZH18]MCI4011011.1 TenA family protein [Brevibacterium sp. ZH18]
MARLHPRDLHPRDLCESQDPPQSTTEHISTTIRLAPGGAVAGLRAAADRSWNAAVDHRFVDELFAGTVPEPVMAKYLVQDYQFFESFLSMLGACVAHADSVASKLRFAKQLGFLEADEDSYFVRSFAEVGVPESDYADPELTVPTAGFREVMDEAVASASYPELLVVLVIAEWLYLDWGERSDPMPDRRVHRGWIELHRGDDFRAWVQFLVDELERVFPTEEGPALEDGPAVEDGPGSVTASERLTRIWHRAVGLELAFFDEAYK